MNALPVTLLVVAKAPEPGRAKTRLAATVGDQVAADIAAAALLDTLDAVAAAPVAARVVALTGDLDAAAGAAEIRRRLESFTVIEQRGDDFADRLANAHADAGTRGAGGHPVLQIGMDTPQVTAELLAGCARRLLRGPGRARAGVRRRLVDPRAADAGGGRMPCAASRCLSPTPAKLTLKALRDNGIDVTLVETPDRLRRRRRCRRGARSLRSRQPLRSGSRCAAGL